MLRGIRFSLKYDMKIHNTLLKAMDVLFALQNHTLKADDIAIYNVLKHVDQETAEFKTQYYNVLRALNFIDTNSYTTFDDYFKNISYKLHVSPRKSPIRVCTMRREDY
jgi:hypothetical protein